MSPVTTQDPPWVAEARNLKKYRDIVEQSIPDSLGLLMNNKEPKDYVQMRIDMDGWGEPEVAAFQSAYDEVRRNPDLRKQMIDTMQVKKDAAEMKDMSKMGMAGAPAIAREPFIGIKSGVNDLMSAVIRPFSSKIADNINRENAYMNQVADEASKGDKTPDWLQTGVRGAVRSIYQASALSTTGMGGYGIIGGFAATRGNQAVTEATDAGLTSKQKWGYVGRAAAIEGGIAGAFQLAGAGGLEKMIGGGSQLTKAGVKAVLKSTGISMLQELPEENITEILDQYNQIVSKVDPNELTWDRVGQILKDTTIQTAMAVGFTGATQGIAAQESLKQRDKLASYLTAEHGLSKEAADKVITEASESKGNFEEALGRKLVEEATKTPEGLAAWVETNPDAAEAVAGKESPSRDDFEAAGLPRVSKEERIAMAEEIRVKNAERREFKKSVERDKVLTRPVEREIAAEKEEFKRNIESKQAKAVYEKNAPRVEKAMAEFDKSAAGIPDNDPVFSKNQDLIEEIAAAIQANNAGLVVEKVNVLTKKIRNRKGNLPKPEQEPSPEVKAEPVAPDVKPEPAATEPQLTEVDKAEPAKAIASDLTFDQFEKQYRDNFKRLMEYEPGMAGSELYAERMAELSGAHPKWAEAIENKPETTGPHRSGSEALKNDINYRNTKNNAERKELAPDVKPEPAATEPQVAEVDKAAEPVEEPAKAMDAKGAPELLEKVARPPANISKWPTETKEGYSVTFMPYGPEGAGFYQSPTPPPAEPPAPKAKIGRKGVTKKAPKTIEKADAIVINSESDLNAVRPRYFELNEKSQSSDGLNKNEKIEFAKLYDAMRTYQSEKESYTPDDLPTFSKDLKEGTIYRSPIKGKPLFAIKGKSDNGDGDLLFDTYYEASIDLQVQNQNRKSEPTAPAKIGRKGVTKKAPATVVIKDEIDMNLIRPRYLELNKKSQTAEGLTEDEKAEVVRIDAALSEYRAKSEPVKKIGAKGVTKKSAPPAKPAAVEVPATAPAAPKAAETAKVKGDTITSPAGEKKARLGTLQPAEQKKYLMAEIDKAIAVAPESSDGETVVIEVPGDGVFTVQNNQTALNKFKSKAEKFPTSVSKPENTKKATLKKNPTAIPKVAKVRPEKRAELDKIMKDALSTDETRQALLTPHLNGEAKELVATDARRMSVALGQEGKTTIHKDVSGTEIFYPNYGQVIPGYRAGQLPEMQKNKSVVNTAYMISKLNQVKAASTGIDYPDPVQVIRMPNGRIEIKWEHKAYGNAPKDADVIEMYQSDDLTGGELIGLFDTKRLKDSFTSLRKMGNEDVTLTWNDRYSPFVAVGKSEYELFMPKLTNEEAKAAAEKREAEKAASPAKAVASGGAAGSRISDAPAGGSGGFAPAPLHKDKIGKKLTQPADIITAIKRDWPELTMSGPATFRKKAPGWYDNTLGTIRLKDMRNVEVALHELGHHFDKLLNKWSGMGGKAKGMPEELERLGRDIYGKKVPVGGYASEGFAELTRAYLSGETSLPGRAPLLYDWFTTYLSENPVEAKRMANLEMLVNNLQLQTPEERVRAFRQPIKKDWSVKRVIAKTAAWVDDNIRDTNLIYNRVLKEAGVTEDAADKHPYLLATALANSAPGRVKHSVMVATTDLFGTETGESLYKAKELVSAMGPEAEEQFWDYMIALRSVDLSKRGIQSGISMDNANAVVTKYDSSVFRDAAERVTDWSRRILEPLVQSGVITKEELADIIKNNPVYVPFSRQFQDGERRPEKSGKAGGRGIYKIKGSGREITHPLDALIWQAERIFTVAAQGMVKKSVVDLYNKAEKTGDHKALGQLLRPVPPPMDATTFSAEHIKKQMADKAIELGADPMDVKNAMMDEWDELLTVYTKATQYKGSQHITKMTIDGETKWYEVTPEFYMALEGMNAVGKLESPLWETIRTVSKASVSLARLGATGLNPGFGIVRNLLRDDTTTFVTGDYKTRIPLVTNLSGVIEEAFADNADTRRYNAMAVGLSGWYGQDSRSTSKLKRQSSATTFGKKAFVEISHPVELARAILGATEAGPRFSEFKSAYKSVIDAGGTEQAAAVVASIAARDVSVNFARAGRLTREANLVSMFLNAGVQSVDKFGRSFYEYKGKKNIPKAAARTLLRAGSWITFMSLLSYYKNRDEKWWQELPSHEKWTHTHWKVGDLTARIPQAFEFGLIFGSLPMAMIEEKRNTGALKEWREQFTNLALPVDISSAANTLRSVQMISPIVDIISNTDWRGEEIVKSYIMDTKEKQDWYSPETSGIAIGLCKILSENANIKISPAQLEHAVNGYTGGIFKRMAGALENVKDPSRMEQPSKLPVVGTLFLRDNTSRITSDFYSKLEKLAQKKGSGTATLEEIGELALANRLANDLTDRWNERREADTSMTAGKAKPVTDKIMQSVLDDIRKHNKEDFREAGIRSVIYSVTAPVTKEKDKAKAQRQAKEKADDVKQAEKLLEGIPWKERYSALTSEIKRNKGNLDSLSTGSGKLTAYGARLKKLRALK